MFNKLVIAVSTTIILTAANALISWITRKVESSDNSRDKKEKNKSNDKENPKCANA